MAEVSMVEFLSKIGVTVRSDGADWPVFEGDYIKFMGGDAFDKAACDQFVAWLDVHGWSYDRHRDRAVRNIQLEAVLAMCRACGFSDEEIREHGAAGLSRTGFEFFLKVLDNEKSRWTAPVVVESARYV